MRRIEVSMMKKYGFALLIALAVLFTLPMGTVKAAGLTPPKAVFQTSSSLDVQSCTISNPNGVDLNITWQDLNGSSSGSFTLGAGGSTNISVSAPNMAQVVLQISYSSDDGQSGSITRAGSGRYWVYVEYRTADTGAVLYSSQEAVSPGGAVSHTAPATYGEYKLVSSASLSHSYNSGTSRTLTFRYQKVVPQDYEITVAFIDETTRANIGSVQVNVPVNGTANYNAPSTYTSGNKSYKLVSNGSISHSYADAARTYEVLYREVPNAPQKPYAITVRYQDADSGKVLTSQSVTIPVNQTVTFNVAPTYVTADGSRYNRASGQPAQIVHEALNTTRRYTVLFTKDNSVPTAPYDITVNYRSAQDGSVLESHSVNVALNTTARHSAPATLTSGGTNYTLASGQNRQITHAFSAGALTYNIYYNAEGANPVEPYDIAVRYVDAATNTTLDTVSVQIPIRDQVEVRLPESFTFNGTDYVLARGQGSAIYHDYDNSRRAYSVFYREAGSPEEEEPVVSPEVPEQPTVPTPTPGTPATPPNIVELPAPGVTPSPEAEQPTPTPETVINDNEVPLAEGNENADNPDEVIDDNEVPLAKGGGNGSSAWIWAAVIAALAVAGGITFVVLKKKKAQTEEKK
ncbi:hypothetical protein [Gehongia tenuis]|uniref:Uncharacterized protein n=1 Tax=Gehongia tenuis TaxID=2763655 RepID=A0A926HR80_9FIRM|nr:hypothetical protein [Gehongia tenuis]MBC8532026.1 hypothetical protein [Gehongia tenuis]